MLVAIGVDTNGYRRVLGVREGAKEDKAGSTAILRYLKKRGLKGVELIISDACIGLFESIGDFYPDAKWQCLNRSFLSQCFQCCASRTGQEGGDDAKGHPCF